MFENIPNQKKFKLIYSPGSQFQLRSWVLQKRTSHRKKQLITWWYSEDHHKERNTVISIAVKNSIHHETAKTRVGITVKNMTKKETA